MKGQLGHRFCENELDLFLASSSQLEGGAVWHILQMHLQLHVDRESCRHEEQVPPVREVQTNGYLLPRSPNLTYCP